MVTQDISGLEERIVLDWNRRPVGRVSATEQDPRTHDLTRLRIVLEPGLVEGESSKELEVSMDKVFGIRREAVQLNESVLSLLPTLPTLNEAAEADTTRIELPNQL